MLRKKKSRYSTSEKLFAAASRILPGGVDSPVRAFKAVGATPVFIERASGAHIEDADGNTYIDYVMSWGPLIHGHAPKGLVKALGCGRRARHEFRRADAARDPARAAGGDADAVDGARALRQLRHRSGHERGARRAGVHEAGQDRQVRRLLSRPRRRFPRAGRIGCDDTRRADQPGVAAAAARDTLVARYNDLDIGRAALRRRIAARSRRSSSSRSPGTWAWSPPREGFLDGLRKICGARGQRCSCSTK